MVNIILVGLPGSGKGTQAKILSQRLGIPHISTGDMFRREMELETPLGLEITESMNAGKYTSDLITNEVVRNRLAEPDAQDGFILDGYPRTAHQVAFLDSLGVEISAVIDIQISPDIAKDRLLKRAKEQSRGDDTAEVIENRVKTYYETVTYVLSMYKTRGVVVEINGIKDIDLVAADIFTAVWR